MIEITGKNGQYFRLEENEICKIYREMNAPLDKVVADVVQYSSRVGKTIATAESCTGGLLSERLTSVPGASRVFELGLCTYAARMKTALLGVPRERIDRYGVVSEEVALSMAKGVQQLSSADICISVTGIAGPKSSEEEPPVGTVYVGVLFAGNYISMPLQLWRYDLTTRASVRYGTAVCAFGLVRRCQMEEDACARKKNK